MGDERLALPLVGRSGERERIDTAWQAVRDGSSDNRLLVLSGDPGIGKSRLTRYAIDVAHANGAGVIEINCGHGYRQVGLGAVRRGIEKALGVRAAPEPGETRAALEARADQVGLSTGARHVLELLVGDADPAVPAPELTPDRLRESIIAALLEWIVAEAKAAPVALVVEDVH